MTEYGYEDAVPDSAKEPYYRYRDGAPDSNDYGYGEGAPDIAHAVDYGYGDGAPDSGRYNDVDYEYGDCTPDSNSYGYGDGAPDSAKSVDYGYEYSSGLNDEEPHTSPGLRGNLNRTQSADQATLRQGGGRQRYRRRGSVTKYSIRGADDVKKEYDQHEDLINKFRNATVTDGRPDSLTSASMHSGMSLTSNSSEDSRNESAAKTKRKLKKRFMKFGGRRGSK